MTGRLLSQNKPESASCAAGMWRLSFLALLSCAVSLQAQRPQASFFESTPFVSGQNGYHTYRIPAIVRATNGVLLAFCEGRKKSSGDAGDIDIVLRRSTDDGETWEEMILVQEEGGGASITIGNPAPVVDDHTGRIHLLFCRDNSRVFHTSSADHGLSWSPRTEITAEVKLPTWGWYATGPGHGVQLKRGTQAGRLVIPSDHTTTNGIRGAHVVYSDNHGATWKLGAIGVSTGGVNPNETICEELVNPAPDGGSRVYFNTRDQGGSAAGTRGQAWSNDGGSSFAGPFTNRAAFICPVVQGSVVRLHALDEGGSTNRILFSCPSDASARTGLSVWSSFDESISWGEPKKIYEGPSAYSDLARTSSGQVALLYERGNTSPYETITFARFNDAWLDKAPDPEPTEQPEPAFWTLEEKSAGRQADTTSGAIKDVHPAGFNSHITSQSSFFYIAGAPAFGAGTALAFDGTGGLQISDMQSGDRFDFGPTNSFTIETVFRIPAGSSQVGALVAKDYGPVLPSWWVRIDNGRPRFLVAEAGFENVLTADILINDGQWHHLAAVRDARLANAKVLRIYVNGVLITNKLDATTKTLANAQPLNIGRFGASTTRNLTGEIDMVRITPKALTPAGFLGRYTQFDADADRLPDNFERDSADSVATLGDGDADGDGASDVLEFALGTDPQDGTSVPVMEVKPDASSVHVLSRQRSLPPWLEMDLMRSADLESWERASGQLLLSPLGGDLWQRTETISYPAGIPAALYFRLHVKPLP